jgi:hypothetical protein
MHAIYTVDGGNLRHTLSKYCRVLWIVLNILDFCTNLLLEPSIISFCKGKVLPQMKGCYIKFAANARLPFASLSETLNL